MVRKNNKRKQQQVDQDKAVKKAKQAVIDKLARKLIEHQTYNKENNISRKDSYGGDFYKLLIEKIRVMGWLTRDMVYKKSGRIRKKNQASVEEVQQETSNNGSAGRPKGTTNEAKTTIVKKTAQATVLLTERYRKAQQECEASRLPPGSYNTMHANILEEVGLGGSGISISKNTIKNRIQKNTLKTTRGPVSPAQAIEPYLLTIAAWRQDAGQPMKKSEMIKLANSLITNSKLQGAVEKHHKTSKVQPTKILGETWFANFKKRNKEELDTGKGTRQHSVRRDWCDYQNFEEMYERLYE